jgi:hypothetical protein
MCIRGHFIVESSEWMLRGATLRNSSHFLQHDLSLCPAIDHMPLQIDLDLPVGYLRVKDKSAAAIDLLSL